jgi:hypothetical protein
MQDAFWKQLDVVKLLAILIIAAWLAATFLKLEIDSTLTNVVMIIVGFFYGSSTGSKAKDAAKDIPPVDPKSASMGERA